MSSITVEVPPAMLAWTLSMAERSGFSQSVMKKLEAWAAGTSKPTLKQLTDVIEHGAFAEREPGLAVHTGVINGIPVRVDIRLRKGKHVASAYPVRRVKEES